MAHVLIYDGNLSIIQEGDQFLDFELHRLDGSKFEGDFRGEGVIQNDMLRLQISSCEFLDLHVAKRATRKSTETLNGWTHASKQVRKRWPANKSQDWYNGYFDCWREKRPPEGVTK